MRQNPSYYHALLKDAGYESEQGWVDYKIVVTPELVERWERALEGAGAQGYEIVPLRDVPKDKLVDQFVATWNTAFDKHWGAAPFTEAEFAERLNTLGIGVLPQARGRGVNLAMASYAYLQLVEQGYSHLSYTLVLDDNWPSRGTGERLGGYVCANYMVYRRNLGRRTP